MQLKQNFNKSDELRLEQLNRIRGVFGREPKSKIPYLLEEPTAGKPTGAFSDLETQPMPPKKTGAFDFLEDYSQYVLSPIEIENDSLDKNIDSLFKEAMYLKRQSDNLLLIQKLSEFINELKNNSKK
jgi:hypothetical protein